MIKGQAEKKKTMEKKKEKKKRKKKKRAVPKERQKNNQSKLPSKCKFLPPPCGVSFAPREGQHFLSAPTC
jgi:hypothetical protein